MDLSTQHYYAGLFLRQVDVALDTRGNGGYFITYDGCRHGVGDKTLLSELAAHSAQAKKRGEGFKIVIDGQADSEKLDPEILKEWTKILGKFAQYL